MQAPSPKRIKFLDSTVSKQEFTYHEPIEISYKEPVLEVEMNNYESETSSPLGLKLTRTSSLVDLIQAALSETNNSYKGFELNRDFIVNQNIGFSPMKEVPYGVFQNLQTQAARSGNLSELNMQDKDKRKATNFSATLVKIGSWEKTARYEGELVVKCYFAKRKLVWEVLEGGLKSKIEVQWSDISAIRASCPRHGPGTLEIQISKPPLFYKESNPQPRKHTLWQASNDFTGNQASMHRRHLLKFAQGVLDKHYEKLIQADSRLSILSKKPFISADRPFFESPRYREDRESGLFCQTDYYIPRILSHHHSFLDVPYRFPGLSPLPFSLHTMVPEFEHLDADERLKSSNSSSSNSSVNSEGSPSPSNQKSNKLQAIADYLLSDHTLVAMQDSMNANLNNGNVPCFQHHLLNNTLVEGSWFV